MVKDVLGGTITPGHGTFPLPNGVCPGHIYEWATAAYTWGANTSNLQDPFTLDRTRPGGQDGGTESFTAEYTPISVTAATQNGPNAPVTATAKLMNPVPYAKGYTWTITGGGGAIVFPNGQESMGSTDSITVEEPNPTGTSVPFSLKVKADVSGTPGLRYGPAADAFCGLPTITSLSPNIWLAGQTYTVTINGTSFNPTASQSCSMTSVNISMSNGGTVTAKVASVTPTQITATVTPGTNDSTGGATVAIVGAQTPASNADVLEISVITWTSDPDGTSPTISGPNAKLPKPSVAVGQQVLLTTTPTAATLGTLPVQVTLATADPPTVPTPWTVGSAMVL